MEPTEGKYQTLEKPLLFIPKLETEDLGPGQVSVSHELCENKCDPLLSQPQGLSFISSRAFHRAQKVPETVLGWCSLSAKGSDDDDINNNIHISIREEVRISEIRKYKRFHAHTAVFNTNNQQGPIV